MKKIALSAVIAALMFMPLQASAGVSHADKISSYEGTKTCAGCHPDSAKEVAESLHYQQEAEPKFLKDWPKGETAGMMRSY